MPNLHLLIVLLVVGVVLFPDILTWLDRRG